jgi:hypothetical protein
MRSMGRAPPAITASVLADECNYYQVEESESVLDAAVHGWTAKPGARNMVPPAKTRTEVALMAAIIKFF